MTTYQVVDFICDLVNPVLFVACVLIIGKLSTKDKSNSIKLGLYLLWNLAITYGIMFLDNAFTFFKGYGLDYSTHTAFALSAGIVLLFLSRRLRLVVGVIVVYAIAMLYQEYHTIEDLIVTVVVVIPLFAIGFKLLRPSRENAQTCI